MRRKAKLDSNQPEIVESLLANGYSVVSLASMHKGIPDLLVGRFGLTILVELKSSVNAKLTEDQVKFKEKWKGGYYVCRSYKEIEKIFKGKINENKRLSRQAKNFPKKNRFKSSKQSKLVHVGKSNNK